ncbi:FAD-dependent oxidoreductase [Streptomyces oceani]|uniref:Pyridine nucleotide-disulfide oxidoreductase n=1 Tax=Streptomyces oceani TaxID=1075402 RepID=A0A1E7JWE5_9ACTN|nr:FAD-dependent oxidoreductase [Streptomyces oceani]OEU95953.1 pyridine nucleotide-disulfide oxidoreductase [Streptomyces oceani]
MRATVAVIGGGYGGVAAAKALDEVADVVLVDPGDGFVHNVALLRGLVDAEWAERIFLPYGGLLEHGRVIQDRAVRVDGETVTLGRAERLRPDYLVLATGSTYPFPAKTDVDDSSEQARARLRTARKTLANADSVLLLGAGPVGLELAGEIKEVWPRKSVVVVDPAADILSGEYPDDFRDALRGQLDGLGVRLVLGTSLRELPPSAPGKGESVTVTTLSGEEITADVWFRCFGAVPNSGYLAAPLTDALRADGSLEVTPELRLPGREGVFAIGDLTALPEAKMAKAAGEHAAVAAANVRALIEGRSELTAYRPSAPGLSLPLGPHGGASYSAEVGVLGADQTSRLKGAHLRMDSYRALLGIQ